MNILIVSQYYAPEPLPKVTELAVGLTEKGHKVTVITGFPNYPYGRIFAGYKLRWWSVEFIAGVRVVRVPLYPDHSRSKFRRFLNFISFSVSAIVAGLVIRRHDVMVVFHPPLTMGVVAWVISRVKRVKYIYCVTDLWPDLMVASGVVKSRILVRLLTVLEHFAYKSADIVAPNSYGMVDRLQQKGVLLEKIRVLPDWADEKLFRPVPPDLGFSQQYGFDTHFTIMFAGQLGVAQDLDTFIDALKLLESNLDVWGVIVGDGLEKDRLMAKVRELGLANVCFTGRVPQESMPSIYATADVMLVQLGSARGFSMSVPQKVYGYMGAGRPILGAVSGATADLINRADCGLVCLPGDAGAMATCITEFAQISKLRREQMGENGRQQFLLEYSRSVTLSKYELTLKELM